MGILWFKKGFRKKMFEKRMIVKKQRFNPNELPWKVIDFTSARSKYRFNIYSMRIGSTSKYTLAQQPPNDFWNELQNPPNGSSFEDAEEGKFMYVRLLKNGVPDNDTILKQEKKDK